MFDSTIEVMSDLQIIEDELSTFNASEEREWMIDGDAYYRCQNDIEDRVILRRMADGTFEEDDIKANNKLAHGFMKNLVDEKISYLLSQDYTLKGEDAKLVDKVKGVLGKKFGYTLNKLGYEASNKGIAWLQPYVDGNGQFKMMMIPSEQCCPIWLDNDHTEMLGMIRYYVIQTYEGTTRIDETKVEWWTKEGVQYYTYGIYGGSSGTLQVDVEKIIQLGYGDSKLETFPHYKKGKDGRSWGKVPFVPFKNNMIEFPDLRFIKTLIDDYDKSRSDVSNFLTDVNNLIFVLRDYGGEDLGTFISEMNYYRAIKVDGDGGVDVINPKMDITAGSDHCESLKSDIITFGQGTRKDIDKIGSAPSGIALKFLYSGLDLKANAFEAEFQNGFDDLLVFVGIYMGESGMGTVKEIDIDLVFNRDTTINESETIQNCVNSKGVVSEKTILANHPWVNDIEEEQKALEVEKVENVKRQQEAFGIGSGSGFSSGKKTEEEDPEDLKE
jgi:SPP1 family phage portal protein